MPRDDAMQYRKGACAVRGGARFSPYNADGAGLKAHASCPEIYTFPPDVTTPQEPNLDSSSSSIDVSSTATLVNPSFDSDKWDSPVDSLCEKALKGSEKATKPAQRSLIQQKKLDHFCVLIDLACHLMNDVWPQSAVPAVFRLQSGAAFGYSPDTRGKSVEDFPDTQSGSDLVSLKKFVTELLKRSRSTAATFQTALCYLEAIRSKIPELQRAEMEGHGKRGEQVNNEGRIEVDPQFAAVNEAENKKLARNNANCKLRKPPTQPNFPLPALPSPLLCPRRTMMGALVLSAKFVQDKCYSNRAWAKLCGLPPREVSRCERVLGDALEWRLWVGRDMLSSFGGLDTKLGRAPTAVLTSHLVEDTKPAYADKFAASLNRAQTWSTPSSQDTVHLPALRATDTEMLISPVPSLVHSSGTGSSNWPSGALSPTVPSPLPLFVSNDPSSLANLKPRISILQHGDTLIYDNSVFGMRGHNEDVFDIRIGNGVEVV